MTEYIMHYAAGDPVVDGKKKPQTSPYSLLGVLLIILGIFLVVGIMLFYLQTTNPPNGVDFACAIVGVEIQIVGFALVIFNRK